MDGLRRFQVGLTSKRSGPLHDEYDDDHGPRLLGWFIDQLPALQILSNVDEREFAPGSPMFALGYKDGRIIIGRASSR